LEGYTADAVLAESEPEISLDITARSDGRVGISVKDNGTGIPEDQLDRIFIPFFSTKEKGSGIGLSLSRQVILMHRGSITVN
jgi:two-component system nitrogen regulation sensor histidine kinase NtrY